MADLAVIPVQDYLGYDTSARINEPSTLGKNWRWRMSREDLNEETRSGAGGWPGYMGAWGSSKGADFPRAGNLKPKARH